MAEVKIILKEKYIKFVSPVPNLKDQRTEENLKPGYLSITTQQVLLIPEKDNQPARDSAIGIAIKDITDFDRKVELWKKALGASRLIPLHHVEHDEEIVSLIATNIDNAAQIKKILSFLVVSGAKIDFVCPFSQGGKIFLDKQPVKGVIRLKKNEVVLSAEWLGKEQKEIIDLLQIDDIDIGDPGSAGTGRSSVTLKYQKAGTVISTLITSDDTITTFFEKYIKIIRGVSDEEEEGIQLNEQQFMLVQMMYTSDIDAEMATEMLGISAEDLGELAEGLVKMDILRISGDEEFELTEKGTKYIVEKMKQGLG